MLIRLILKYLSMFRNENVIDVEVEKIACSCFPNLESTYNPLCELLNMILRVKGEVKMIDLSKNEIDGKSF